MRHPAVHLSMRRHRDSESIDEAEESHFARKLVGLADEIAGYALTMLKIEAPQVVATSGKARHLVATYSGNTSNKASGMVATVAAGPMLPTPTPPGGGYIGHGPMLPTPTPPGGGVVSAA